MKSLSSASWLLGGSDTGSIRFSDEFDGFRDMEKVELKRGKGLCTEEGVNENENVFVAET